MLDTQEYWLQNWHQTCFLWNVFNVVSFVDFMITAELSAKHSSKSCCCCFCICPACCVMQLFTVPHPLLLSILWLFLRQLNPHALQSKPSTAAMFAKRGLEENETTFRGSDYTDLAMLIWVCWYCLTSWLLYYCMCLDRTALPRCFLFCTLSPFIQWCLTSSLGVYLKTISELISFTAAC